MQAAQSHALMVIRPPRNGTWGGIKPFLQPGMPVAIGRGLAFIEELPELIELPLCESRNVKLRTDVVYRFNIEAGCGFCEAMAEVPHG